MSRKCFSIFGILLFVSKFFVFNLCKSLLSEAVVFSPPRIKTEYVQNRVPLCFLLIESEFE